VGGKAHGNLLKTVGGKAWEENRGVESEKERQRSVLNREKHLIQTKVPNRKELLGNHWKKKNERGFLERGYGEFREKKTGIRREDFRMSGG